MCRFDYVVGFVVFVGLVVYGAACVWIYAIDKLLTAMKLNWVFVHYFRDYYAKKRAAKLSAPPRRGRKRHDDQTNVPRRDVPM